MARGTQISFQFADVTSSLVVHVVFSTALIRVVSGTGARDVMGARARDVIGVRARDVIGAGARDVIRTLFRVFLNRSQTYFGPLHQL